MSFQAGDWVFCEFELQQITEVCGERVQQVTNGLCSHSSFDMTDRCFPLTLAIKRVSDEFEYHSNQIHKKGASGLNFPRIHEWLVRKWVDACRCAMAGGDMKPFYTDVQTFALDLVQKQEIDSGYGFPLMRTP